MTYNIIRNDKTSLYEIHALGCKHSNLRHMEVLGTITAVNATDAAQTFEAQNEDCLAKIGPCAK